MKERRGQPTTTTTTAYANEGIRIDMSDAFQVSMPVRSAPNEVTRPPVEGHDVIGHVGAKGRSSTEHAERDNETGFGVTWNAQQHQHPHQQSPETGESDRAQWSLDLKDMLNDLQEGQLSDRQEGQLNNRQEGQLSDRQEGQLSDRQGQPVDVSGDRSFLDLLESDDFLQQDVKHHRNFSPPADSLDRNVNDLTFDDSANHDACQWIMNNSDERDARDSKWNNPVIHDVKDPTSVDLVSGKVSKLMPSNSINHDLKDTAYDVWVNPDVKESSRMTNNPAHREVQESFDDREIY